MLQSKHVEDVGGLRSFDTAELNCFRCLAQQAFRSTYVLVQLRDSLSVPNLEAIFPLEILRSRVALIRQSLDRDS